MISIQVRALSSENKAALGRVRSSKQNPLPIGKERRSPDQVISKGSDNSVWLLPSRVHQPDLLEPISTERNQRSVRRNGGVAHFSVDEYLRQTAKNGNCPQFVV